MSDDRSSESAGAPGESHWQPSGLPGALKPLPGWAARGLGEARFSAELARFVAAAAHGLPELVAGLPHGGGRPVLVVPGFGFGDSSTLPMRMALTAAGYRVVQSGIVFNVRCSDRAVDGLIAPAHAAMQSDGGRRLLVVGHSRGGMLARGLGARRPDLVDTVISLGAPLNHEFAFYEIPRPLVAALRTVHSTDPQLRQRKCATPDCTCPYMAATKQPMPPGVRLVSIYTKADGIVDWRACVVPGAENFEVGGSHLGMGLNPETLRLALSLLTP